MGFDKIRQGREEIFILVVESPEIINGKKERERWTVMKKDFPRLIENTIAPKFGLSINTKSKDNKDLEWLGIKE